MKKLLDVRRGLILGLFVVLGTAALFYANPPTPGRAFFKKAETVDTVGTNRNRTPDTMLW